MIDENGYLFGVVNVIDALVLAVLAAMIGAGLAVANINDGVVVTVPLAVVISGLLVFTVSSDTDDPQTEVEQETWYMTLDLGTQPAYVVDRIGEGDAIVVTEFDGPISVVDVHTPFSTGPSSITLRAEVIGGFREDEYGRPVFHFDGEPLLLGTELTLDMGSFVTNATVSELERDSPSLSIEETTVVAAVAIDNVSPTIAAGLEEGMVETVRDEPVATIDSVEREPATVYREDETGNTNGQEHPQNVDVKLQIVLRTTKTETGLRFRGERLTLGTTIALDFGPVAVDGKVTRIDSSKRTRSVPETSTAYRAPSDVTTFRRITRVVGSNGTDPKRDPGHVERVVNAFRSIPRPRRPDSDPPTPTPGAARRRTRAVGLAEASRRRP